MLLVYLVTALVPSDTACLANSPGKSSLTAVWISREEIVFFLFWRDNLDASEAIRSKISLTNEFMMLIASKRCRCRFRRFPFSFACVSYLRLHRSFHLSFLLSSRPSWRPFRCLFATFWCCWCCVRHIEFTNLAIRDNEIRKVMLRIKTGT